MQSTNETELTNTEKGFVAARGGGGVGGGGGFK